MLDKDKNKSESHINVGCRERIIGEKIDGSCNVELKGRIHDQSSYEALSDVKVFFVDNRGTQWEKIEYLCHSNLSGEFCKVINRGYSATVKAMSEDPTIPRMICRPADIWLEFRKDGYNILRECNIGKKCDDIEKVVDIGIVYMKRTH